MNPRGTPLVDQLPEAVRGAVRHLYKAFASPKAGKRVNHWIDGLHSAEECAALERAGAVKRVDELTASEYDHLAWHAMCWDAAERETVAYFLPRVMEEFAAGTSGPVPVDMIIHNLRGTGWPSGWPDERRVAFSSFVWALWGVALVGQGHGRPGPEEVLRVAAVCRVDLAPLLAAWRADNSKTARLHLAKFVLNEAPANGVFTLSGWEYVWNESDSVEPEIQRRVIEWLMEPATAAALEEAFFNTDNRRDQELLSAARNILP